MRILITLLLLNLSLTGFSNKSASELYLDLQKLHSFRRVLYIAAHPDDENTRALAWFSLGEKAETAYLSLTRGDGGQNLIGDELSEKLGVLRTQELLSARSFDGANQYFSRAVDFGYSKSASESLEKWGEAEILSDVVRIIREFKPDVIITRFPPDKRAGHGHHTASALLAIEAFSKAADKNYEPNQVAQFGTWQATSLYWNTSYWWNKEIVDSAKGNDDYMVADIGGYNPQLGMSYNEIGTLARSEHKCQGFGAVVERGERIEYFQHLEGLKLKESFFEKNDKTWASEVNENTDKLFEELLASFDFVNPENNVPYLLNIQEELNKMKESSLKSEKLKRCNRLIQDCLGLYLEVVSSDYSFISGEVVKLKFNAINRSNQKVQLSTISINGAKVKSKSAQLEGNKELSEEFEFTPKTILGGPYWLRNDFGDVFNVDNDSELGSAEALPSLTTSISLTINDKSVVIDLPVEYKWRVPDFGEKRRDLVCTPRFTANFDQKITLVKPGESKKIKVKIHSFANELNETLNISGPKGWTITPSSVPFDISGKHEEKWLEFEVTSSDESIDGNLNLTNGLGEIIQSYQEIAYDHIPTQTLINPSKIKCIKLDAAINKGKVAYITGVVDAVPAAISELGFDVEELTISDLATANLSDYQTILIGIRAYNVHEGLMNYNTKLYEYVEAGGNLIMQYNTASRAIRDEEFGPYPFKLSRNRVTEEDAEVSFLNKKHPILNSPNKLSKDDFEGWVQERGLYFASDWSSEYEALFSWHDIGEDPQEGALIVAKHGKGQFVYTGISFFRELPNGVVGAYRLFANLLSYKP
ncbi:MAG: LmbE family N-acetylglucosaminyl deacetylase [Arenicella sp.]|jgi:LmbE family N-acetylglucosaminyl deacetylase